VSEAVLVILFGLTAKTALDQLFGVVSVMDGPAKLWDALKRDPVWHFALVGQGVIFFLTCFRFYLGSLRYHQMRAHHTKVHSLLLDIVGTFILFMGFYICALSIKSQLNFYPFMAVLHILDGLWFVGAWAVGNVPEAQQTFIKRFIILDGVTVLVLLSIAVVFGIFEWRFGGPYFFFNGLCFLALLVVGIVDFGWNRGLYVGSSS